MTIINGVRNKTLMQGVTAIPDVVDAPGTPTATAGALSASVAFTPAVTGGAATTFTAISTPGSITGSAASSPVTVSGLTAGTAYTFRVYGNNASGNWTTMQSAASNSVTPTDREDFESLATATGGSGSITFSNIPGTYQHLQIRALIKDTSTSTSDQGFILRFNGDTASNYSWHRLEGDGSVTSAGGAANATWMISNKGGASSNASYSNMFGVAIIDIHDYANTSKNKTARWIAGTDTNSTTGAGIVLQSGLWRSTNAITNITILAGGSAFTSSSTFALYGIKGA